VTTGEEGLDPRAAAALLQATTEQTRRSLEVSRVPLYLSWGLAWLVGLGAMWLSVRDQHPYQGPSGGAGAVLGLLVAAAIAVTVVTVHRATHGLEGGSAVQGRMFGLAWPIGYGTLFALEGALAHAGASDTVLGLVGAAGPVLVTGLIYLVGAAVWADRPMFATGAWLALVAAVGGYTGPVGMLLLGAVAGGGGFLVTAAYLLRRGRA
jgi:hypothetical protein